MTRVDTASQPAYCRRGAGEPDWGGHGVSLPRPERERVGRGASVTANLARSLGLSNRFLKLCADTTAFAGTTTRRGVRTARFGLLAAALLLAGCASSGMLDRQASTAVPDSPKPAAVAESDPAAQREHERILAAYNGAYEDPRIEAMVSQTVEKLVAASERPDLHYRITLLNSPVVNAFALPTGQLYVTRGLIALANDRSELASVMAHEMSHVIAHHAEMREDRVKQVALVSRMVNGVLSDPETGALALAKSKIALASFSRAQEFEADGSGSGSRRAPDTMPMGRRASSPRSDAIRTCGNPDQRTSIRARRTSCPRIPPPRSGSRTRRRPPARSGRPAAARVTATTIWPPSTAWSTATIRAKAWCAAVTSCIPGSDSPSWPPRASRSTTPRKPSWASRKAAARRCGSTWCGCRPNSRCPTISTPAGSRTSTAKSIESTTINGFPAATATAKGDQWSFRLFAVRFGSDVYRFIFATKHMTPEIDQSFRDSVGSFRRMSIAESKAARPLRLRVVTVGNGDTVEQLASRMAVVDRKLERFRILNGLEAGRPPQPRRSGEDRGGVAARASS